MFDLAHAPESGRGLKCSSECYEAPRLEVLGSVAELTQGPGGSYSDGPNGLDDGGASGGF